MALVTWPNLGIRAVTPSLDRPAQINRSPYTGKRTAVVNPWHGIWRFHVELATVQGDANFRSTRAFLAKLKGQLNWFHLPAVEGPQVSLSGTPLDLNFGTGSYAYSGGSTGTLSSVPGYSYARTGAESVLDSDNSIDSFAANNPPVNGFGYHAYDALTNLLLQTQTFDNASWAKTRASISANATTAPDGTSTADKLVEDTSVTLTHNINEGFTAAASTTYTLACFVKAAGRTQMKMTGGGSVWATATPEALFDLSAVTVSGVASGASATITNVGSGWFLCTLTGTSSGSGGASGIHMRPCVAGNENYTGDGASGLYLWQAQVYAGRFPEGGPLLVATGSTASIGAPAFSVSCPNGTYTATYTFDDASTQDRSVTVSGGAFTLETYPTLNRPRVKRVQVTGTMDAVTAASSAAQAATSITLTSNPGVTEGMMATVILPSGNRQLVAITGVSGSVLTFEPPLREAISAGASVIVTIPTCQVAMASSSSGWSIASWRRYGVSFDVEEVF